MWNKYSFFKFVFLFCFGIVFAQKIPERGIPFLQNFSPKEYHNAGKIWDSQQAPNHLLYMASEKGLLEFDGSNWALFKGSSGYTRSLLVQSDSVIYTGSDSDFGIWKKNQFNQFTYQSLYPFKDSEKEIIEEFWAVHKIEENIAFQSFNNIYFYKNQQITKIPAPYRFSKSFLLDNKLYLIDEKYGIYLFNGIELKNIYPFSEQKWNIVSLYQENENFILITKENGILKLSQGVVKEMDTEISPLLKKAQVFSFEKINNDYLAFGTILNGIYISDGEGKIIQHINKKKGLLNNTALSLFYTQEGNLWAGMDYGITEIHLVSDFSYFIDNEGRFGSAYTALLDGNTFYLGTNQGLYKIGWDEMKSKSEQLNLQLIPGTEGQVWQLKKVNGTILCGHDKGLFRLENNNAQWLHKEPGAWEIQAYDKNHILVGNYNGINVFEYKNNQWIFLKKINGIVGGCKQIILDKKNKIWVNIPNFGILHSSFDANWNLIDNQIFNAEMFEGEELFLYKENKHICLQSPKQTYIFSPEKNQFDKIENSLSQDFPNGLSAENHTGIPIDDVYDFFPLHNGFSLKNRKNTPFESAPQTPLITHVYSFNNEERQEIILQESIPYDLNNIELHFVLPQNKNALFRYRLSDEESWSDWSPKSQVEFYGLNSGDYSFFVESKNAKGTSKSSVFEFSIATPWFKKWYAFLFYLCLIAALAYLMNRWHALRLKKQKIEHLKKEQNSLREQAEKYNKQEWLKTKKALEEEKIHLQKELSNKAKELAKKSKQNKDNDMIVHKIRNEIINIEENTPSKAFSKKLRGIHRILDSYLDVEDNIFEIQIDEINQEFFKKLKNHFSELTPYDLRLCAYLKMGMKTKEIAEIIGVLPSSINVSRSRLRKKLNLNPNQDLYEFLNKLY